MSIDKPPQVKTRVGRIIWKCKCGLIQAHDYDYTQRLSRVDRMGVWKYGPAQVARWVDGVHRHVSHDVRCPNCGRDRKGAEVVGRTTGQPCNAKCVSSTGPKCDCSCGGANHGRGYL